MNNFKNKYGIDTKEIRAELKLQKFEELVAFAASSSSTGRLTRLGLEAAASLPSKEGRKRWSIIHRTLHMEVSPQMWGLVSDAFFELGKEMLV